MGARWSRSSPDHVLSPAEHDHAARVYASTWAACASLDPALPSVIRTSGCASSARALPESSSSNRTPTAISTEPFTPGHNRLGRIDAEHVIDALGDSGTRQYTVILEAIPAFEQEDDAVLDDLARSVDYWREARTRAECGGGQG